MPLLEWFKEISKKLRPQDNGLRQTHENCQADPAPAEESPSNHYYWQFKDDDAMDSVFHQMNEMIKDFEGIFKQFPVGFESFNGMGYFPNFPFESSMPDVPDREVCPRDQMLKTELDPINKQSTILKVPDFQLLPKGSMTRDEDLDEAVRKQEAFGGFAPSHKEHQCPSTWFSHSVSTSRQLQHFGDGRIEERVMETARDGTQKESITRSVGDATCRTIIERRADGTESRHQDVQGIPNNDLHEFNRLWASSETSEVSGQPITNMDRMLPFKPKF